MWNIGAILAHVDTNIVEIPVKLSCAFASAFIRSPASSPQWLSKNIAILTKRGAPPGLRVTRCVR